MCNSLLLIARSVRPIIAKEVTRRLKDQRDEKRRNEKLELSLSIDEATYGHINVLFLWNKQGKGEFWYAEDQALLEISKIKRVNAKRNVLKEQITNCDKGFGWSECKTCWSVQGKQHAV